MLSYIIQGPTPMLASYKVGIKDIGVTSRDDVANYGETIGYNATKVRSNSASVTQVVGTTAGVTPNTYDTTTTQSFSYTVGANGYETTSVVFRGRISMLTYTASQDVYDRIGTTTGITLSTGAFTGTDSTVLTQATTSTEQGAEYTYSYERVPHNAPTSVQYLSSVEVVAKTASVVPTGRNFAFADFNTVQREAVQILTNCTTGVSTTNWRAWCRKITTDATVQDTFYMTSQMPTISGSFSYTRDINTTTGPWIYYSRVAQTLTRSREFNYDYQMYSTTEDSLGDPIFTLWWPYPNSSTQTEFSTWIAGPVHYFPADGTEITSTQWMRLTETITNANANFANRVPVSRPATVWYTKSTRDLFGQRIDAGIGTTEKLIVIGEAVRSDSWIIEEELVKYSPSFITMGFGYTEWARSFNGYAPAGAGTRSSEYGELTSHAGVLDLWPFEQWDTYWYSEQESYYSLPGVARVAPGVLALPPFCAVSSSIAGVGSVSVLVDGENISYTTASSKESSSGTVTFVSIESASFTYKIQKMGSPVTYYQFNSPSRVNPNDLGVSEFQIWPDNRGTTRFFEKRGSEIFKDHTQLLESFNLAGADYNPGGQYGLLSNNPYYLTPRVVQAPAKNMAFPETIALWGCFDTATGTTPATTIYSEYTTFLKSAYARFRPIVLASLA